MIEIVMTLDRAYEILAWESESFEGAITGDEKDRVDYTSDLFRKAHSEELYTAQQLVLKAVNSILKGTGVQDGKSQDFKVAS